MYGRSFQTERFSMKHIFLKIKRDDKKIVVSVMISVLCLLVLTGCIPNGYTRKEKNAFLKDAKQMASAYLESTYSGAKVKYIDAVISIDNMEYVLTEFASGQFDWQGQPYNFVIDTETGEVYTSVHFEEIKERLSEEVLLDLGIVSREAAVLNCRVRYLQGGSPGIGQINWGWVDTANVFPEGKTVEELLLKILTDERAYSFYIDIQYKGEEIPQEIMEEESLIPTLTDIDIYHIAEKHGLYEGERGYFYLPCISEEIMKRNYEDDTAEYTRNQVLERNGFQVVYNAYEKTREQDIVTEAVIGEEDIELTVRDDYIALSCTKEHFTMYLITRDRNTVQEYLYSFDYTISEKKPGKGKWNSYEDFYIYSDAVYIEIPYAFNSYKKEKNVIFSKENYNIF